MRRWGVFLSAKCKAQNAKRRVQSEPIDTKYCGKRNLTNNLIYFFARQGGRGEVVSGIPRADRHKVLRKKKQITLDLYLVFWYNSLRY